MRPARPPAVAVSDAPVPVEVVIVTVGAAALKFAPQFDTENETTFPTAFVITLPVALVPPVPAATENVSEFA